MAQTEAADKLSPVYVPAPEGARRPIDVAHRLLGRMHGAVAIAGLQLRDEGRTVGVLTLERMPRGGGQGLPEDARAFDAGTRESLELVAALAGPLVASKRREQRWLGGRLRDGTQAAAELALVDERLTRTRLVAPLGGLVVSGDFSQMLGSPVEQGRVLFEIAPLDALRVVLHVHEADFALVARRHDGAAPLEGELPLTGEAGRALPFRVTLVTPVASVRDGENGFRVEALLTDGGEGRRPGMEGIAKITLGRTSALHAWTRETIDRLRLLIWRWTP